MYNVFISFKKTDDEGELTKDFEIAKELYNELKEYETVQPFFSDESIYTVGKSNYKDIINNALDEVDIVVVIGTTKENIESKWVKYEWESFHNDILANNKPNGEIIGYIADDINHNDLPRSIRSYQSFKHSLMSVVGLAVFIEKCITQKNKNSQAAKEYEKKVLEIQSELKCKKKEQSYYSPLQSNELSRLQIQSENAYHSDISAIDYAKRNMESIKDLVVLDVGSAYGVVAHSRFGEDESVKQVICIDKDSDVVEQAKHLEAITKLKFFTVDIESPDLESHLEKICIECGVERFDIVFSALTVHHLKDPNKFLRRIRKYLSDDGCIIVRGSDDSSKLCYPHSELLKEIIDRGINVKGASDRLNGEKIHSQLINSGYSNVKILSFMRDTSTMNMEERELLYFDSFSYRINPFASEREKYPEDKRINEEFEYMKELLNEFENYFYEPSFWYAEYDYIGIAKKG